MQVQIRDGLVGRELPSHCIRQVGSQPGAEGPAAAGQVLASGKGSGLGEAPLRAACPLSAGLCQSLSSQGHPWSWLLIGGSAGTAHGTPARPPARSLRWLPLAQGLPAGIGGGCGRALGPSLREVVGGLPVLTADLHSSAGRSLS